MRPLLDFDDAGAGDDEPAKGVTVGDIRAWFDEMDRLKVLVMGPPKEYWQGYLDAIRQADVHLQCRGDDRTIRECRKAVLSLVGVHYDPNHVVPIPAWPPEEYLLATLPQLAAHK